MNTEKNKADSDLGWQILQRLAGMNAHEVQPILDVFDFGVSYPIVDGAGCLTGDVVSGDAADGYRICDCDDSGISAVDQHGDGTADRCMVNEWAIPAKFLIS